jgi:hypothetical protein
MSQTAQKISDTELAYLVNLAENSSPAMPAEFKRAVADLCAARAELAKLVDLSSRAVVSDAAARNEG